MISSLQSVLHYIGTNLVPRLSPSGRFHKSAPRLVNEVAHHPLRTGEVVRFYRVQFSHRPLVGTGCIVGPVDGVPDCYFVRVGDGEQLQRRFVHAGPWQDESDEILAALLDHWRASIDPTLLTTFGPLGQRIEPGK
ncbi:MAG TPA: hypothetical protein VHE81_01350 [Lacipirellulaceae bacterium]|nr:hypothetical protein [Lacipirellulaceae bacterium]